MLIQVTLTEPYAFVKGNHGFLGKAGAARMFMEGLKLLWDGMDENKCEEVKRVYIPIGNFLFLSDEKKFSKMYTTIEFNRVVEALDILKYSKQEASRWLEKTLVCAVANWEYKLGGTESADDYDLVISETFADSGAQLKRFRPAPHGRAHRIRVFL